MHLQTLQFTYMYLQSITGEGNGEEGDTAEHSLAAVKDKGGRGMGGGEHLAIRKSQGSTAKHTYMYLRSRGGGK